MTEPKKIKTKKKEEQPFGMEKLRRLAEESESFEGYMEKVIPELLAIKPKMDKGDNSIQAVYKKILSETPITEESVIKAVANQEGSPSSQLIGLIENTSTQVRRLSDREDLIILCFAIVACGGSVEQCDELALAGVSDKYHSRELYQLDAREGFFRFVLYWNQRCHWEGKQNLMITYSKACEVFDDKVLLSLKEKIDEELEVLENLLLRDDTESTIIPELMELLKALQTSIEKSNTNLTKKFEPLQKDYLDLLEKSETLLHELENYINSHTSELDEKYNLLSELVMQLTNLKSLVLQNSDNLSSAIGLQQKKCLSFSSKIADMQNKLVKFQTISDLDFIKKRDSLSELMDYFETLKTILRDGRLDLVSSFTQLGELYKTTSEECEKSLKIVCSLLLRINDNDSEETVFLSDCLKSLQLLRKKIYSESKSGSMGLSTSTDLNQRCNSVSREIDTGSKKIQFILDLMDNLKIVNNSEEEGYIDASRAGKILQNVKKRYSRGKENDNPTSHQCLTTSMQHNTSAWVTEVEYLVNHHDLDQPFTFENACEVYIEMAGNFVRDKDWTAVSIIIQAMCSERYKVNYRYYMIGTPTIKSKKTSKENSDKESDKMPKQKKENDDKKTGKGLADKKRNFVITTTKDSRVSRAILPEEVLSKVEKGNIGRLINPTMRYISNREVFEEEDQGLLIPDRLITSDQSEPIDKLVSMCGLLEPKGSRELNGVVSTTKRQTLLRFAIACNYTSQSDYETILGLSGKNQFILTNKRESFVLSILVWISIKYKAENYVKYSVLETVKYAEIILLYYFAKKRNEEKTSSVFFDEKSYSEIAVFDLNQYEVYMDFYSLVSCIMTITKPIDFDSKNFNVYSYLLSGYEIPLPFINYNYSHFPKSPDSITDSEWENVCVLINQTLDSLFSHFSEFREIFAEKIEGKAFTLDMDQYLLCFEVLNYCEELYHYFKNQKRFNETFQLIKKLLIETNTLNELFNEVFQGIHTSDETEDNN